jgi:hypothetical protein
LGLLCVTNAFAAEGSLQIKFTLDGQAPKPAALPVGGVAFCGPKMVVDESLVVGPKNEIQNIVVWMLTTKDIKAPESEPAMKALAKEAKVDNLGCRYEPRITLLHTSQQLVVGNPDPIGHNTKGDLFANPPFNELIPAGASANFKFGKTESRPMPLSCAIHPWMGGYLLIRDNPFFGVSNAQGVLTIPHIPGGKYTFVIWHEKCGYVPRATLGGKTQEWKTGRMEATIAGDTDLGEIKIPLKVLVK